MWAMWVLAAAISVVGYYALNDEISLTMLTVPKNVDLAGNMGIYRDSVLTYLHNHPEVVGPVVVNDSALSSTLPSWYSRYPLWTNYVAADGLVTIYATSLPPTKITSQIYELSQRSIFAGEAKNSTGTLYSPVYGNTNIPLPAGVAIPDGSPVWMGKRY